MRSATAVMQWHEDGYFVHNIGEANLMARIWVMYNGRAKEWNSRQVYAADTEMLEHNDSDIVWVMAMEYPDWGREPYGVSWNWYMFWWEYAFAAADNFIKEMER